MIYFVSVARCRCSADKKNQEPRDSTTYSQLPAAGVYLQLGNVSIHGAYRITTPVQEQYGFIDTIELR